MRLDIHVYHHIDGFDGGIGTVLAAISTLQGNITTMNEKLQEALQGLVNEVNDSNTKLGSVLLFAQGVPNLVAIAVAEALAAHDVDAEAAAATIDAARNQISDQVDAVVAAVDANTPPEEVPPGPGAGEEPADPATDPTVGAADDALPADEDEEDETES